VTKDYADMIRSTLGPGEGCNEGLKARHDDDIADSERLTKDAPDAHHTSTAASSRLPYPNLTAGSIPFTRKSLTAIRAALTTFPLSLTRKKGTLRSSYHSAMSTTSPVYYLNCEES
jgi:hypothetical protein